jgi:hypothetical protein
VRCRGYFIQVSYSFSGQRDTQHKLYEKLKIISFCKMQNLLNQHFASSEKRIKNNFFVKNTFFKISFVMLENYTNPVIRWLSLLTLGISK